MTNDDPRKLARRRGRQRGSLRRGTVSWIARWWEPTITASGKSHWRRRKKAICPVTKTETEAWRIFHEAILQGVAVRSVYPQMLSTLREFWATKFAPTLQYKKRKGRQHYEYIWSKFVEPALGGMELRDVTAGEVQTLIDQKFHEGYSPQTLSHIRQLVGRLFKVAKQFKWYSGDLPTVGVELPEMNRTRDRVVLSRADFLRLVEALPQPAGDMVFVLGLLGLRKGELLGLKWKRVNLSSDDVMIDGETISPFHMAIREAYVRVPRKWERGLDGKRVRLIDPNEKYGDYQTLKKPARRMDTASKRTLPLASEVVEVLQEIWKEAKFQAPEDPVFAGPKGKPVDDHNVANRQLRPTLRALGLPRMSWHDFRHCSATWAEQGGATVTARKKMYGWTQDRMALYYSHADLEELRVAFEKVAEGMKMPKRGNVQ